MNAILETIMKRTSVRDFDPERPVTSGELSDILHAAMASPSAVNRQPWHFVAVTDRQSLDALSLTLPYCRMAKTAPAAIVCCGDSSRFLTGTDSELWVQDLSAASENILLAACALGLGAVWTCLYPHTDRMKSAAAILHIPDRYVPFNVIPFGHPASVHEPINKWNPKNVTYVG